jgi:protein phosphatase
LFWISIGDSPLYLLRDGRLRQLNEDHSLGPHIDYMVRSGMMSEDVGRNHPDRNALTSVLIGEAIERIDCPEKPFRMRSGDILIVASDGLQFLSDSQITDIVSAHSDKGAAVIAESLLDELRELDDPEQDNVCFSIIRVDFRGEAKDSANIFTADFERSSNRPRQVTTRPIGPARPTGAGEAGVSANAGASASAGASESAVATAENAPAPTPKSGMNGRAKTENPEATPIFLRRRWLATDGGA